MLQVSVLERIIMQIVPQTCKPLQSCNREVAYYIGNIIRSFVIAQLTCAADIVKNASNHCLGSLLHQVDYISLTQ